jgi:hypothetical protein
MICQIAKKKSTVTEEAFHVMEASYCFGRNIHCADENTCQTFPSIIKQPIKMTKSKVAAAAVSSKSKHTRRGVPSAITIRSRMWRV